MVVVVVVKGSNREHWARDTTELTHRKDMYRVSAIGLCCFCAVCLFLTFVMRPSSLGGGRILRRTLSVCLSVRPVIITERHVAPPSELQ